MINKINKLYCSNIFKKVITNNDEFLSRRKKLSQIRKTQIAFPNDFRCNYISCQLHERYKHKTNKELNILNITVRIAGRVVARRIMGKASFIKLLDSGGYIQLYISIDSYFSQEKYDDFIKTLDIGDIIGVKGTLFQTKTEELSIRCTAVQLLTKSLRPLPNKFHGLIDIETKYRQRYLDLITNNQSRAIFKKRSLIISKIRQFMNQKNFMEVETPMLHKIPGGAVARPFITYHNKLKMNMYLRIAPELYLKQLLVGGFDRIFEINRNFRNESISPYHNPEFTMMEVYIAYADYLDMIVFTENLLNALIKQITGNNIIKYGKYVLDFSIPFMKMNMKEAIKHYIPDIQLKDIDDCTTVIDIIKSFGIPVHDQWTLEKLQIVLFEEIVSKKIIQPTYITHYPIEISPLSRCNDHNPKLTDRFELFISGQEIGNGFSELNDPEDQKQRFIKQIQDRDKTENQDKLDQAYVSYDEDYLDALEYGLPPAAGVGIGIDRLVMLLTNQHNIRDVILFPTLRPKSSIYVM